MEIRLSDLVPSQAYKLQFRAVGPTGSTEWTNTYSITLPNDTTIPNNVTGAAVSYSGGNFTLAWSPVSTVTTPDLREYRVQVSNSATPNAVNPAIYRNFSVASTQTVFNLPIDLNTSIFGAPQRNVWFHVWAVDTSATANISAVVSTTAASYPVMGGNPTLTASPGVGSIAYSWTLPTSYSDIYDYSNFYFGTNADPFTHTPIKVAGNSITRSGTNPTNYNANVRVYDVFGGTPLEGPITVSATPTAAGASDTDPPDQPVLGTVTSALDPLDTKGLTAIATLTWQQVADVDIAGYEVEYKKNADSVFINKFVPAKLGLAPDGTPAGNTITTKIENLAAGTQYNMQVRAVDGVGNFSTWATYTPNPTMVIDTTRPDAPTGLTARWVNGDLIVKWDASPATDLTGYVVQFGSSGTYSPAITANVTDTTVTLTSQANVAGLSGGAATVYVHVAAKDGIGAGAYSTPDVTSTRPALPAPTNFQAVALDGRIQFSWDPVPGATSYKIYEDEAANMAGAIETQTVVGATSFTKVFTTTAGVALYYGVHAVPAFGTASGTATTNYTVGNNLMATAIKPLTASAATTPASSPAAKVAQGPGTIFVNWVSVPNYSPVTYEVHVGTSSGFTPLAASLVGETTGNGYIVRKSTAAGAALAENTNYYIKIIAKGAASAAAGLVSSAVQIGPIDDPVLLAEQAHINQLYVGSLKVVEGLNANDIKVGAISSSQYSVDTVSSQLEPVWKIDLAGDAKFRTGTIGQWTISDKDLTSGNVGLSANPALVDPNNASRIIKIWAGGAGSGNAQNAPFKVYDDGSIKASQGEVGGWSLLGADIISTGSSIRSVYFPGTKTDYADSATASSLATTDILDVTLRVSARDILTAASGTERRIIIGRSGVWSVGIDNYGKPFIKNGANYYTAANAMTIAAINSQSEEFIWLRVVANLSLSSYTPTHRTGLKDIAGAASAVATKTVNFYYGVVQTGTGPYAYGKSKYDSIPADWVLHTSDNVSMAAQTFATTSNVHRLAYDVNDADLIPWTGQIAFADVYSGANAGAMAVRTSFRAADTSRTTNVSGDWTIRGSIVGVSASASNPINDNHDFASNITGWTQYNVGTTVTRETTSWKVGGASMKMVAGSGITGAMTTSTFPCEPNKKYTLSAFVSDTVTAYVEFYDSTPTFISSPNSTFGITSTAFDKKNSFTTVAPANAASMRVIFTFATPVTRYIDAVRLENGETTANLGCSYSVTDSIRLESSGSMNIVNKFGRIDITNRQENDDTINTLIDSSSLLSPTIKLIPTGTDGVPVLGMSGELTMESEFDGQTGKVIPTSTGVRLHSGSQYYLPSAAQDVRSRKEKIASLVLKPNTNVSSTPTGPVAEDPATQAILTADSVAINSTLIDSVGNVNTIGTVTAGSLIGDTVISSGRALETATVQGNYLTYPEFSAVTMNDPSVKPGTFVVIDGLLKEYDIHTDNVFNTLDYGFVQGISGWTVPTDASWLKSSAYGYGALNWPSQGATATTAYGPAVNYPSTIATGDYMYIEAFVEAGENTLAGDIVVGIQIREPNGDVVSALTAPANAGTSGVSKRASGWVALPPYAVGRTIRPYVTVGAGLITSGVYVRATKFFARLYEAPTGGADPYAAISPTATAGSKAGNLTTLSGLNTPTPTTYTMPTDAWIRVTGAPVAGFNGDFRLRTGWAPGSGDSVTYWEATAGQGSKFTGGTVTVARLDTKLFHTWRDRGQIAGRDGSPTTWTSVTAETLPYGDNPTAVIGGISPANTLAFGIPEQQPTFAQVTTGTVPIARAVGDLWIDKSAVTTVESLNVAASSTGFNSGIKVFNSSGGTPTAYINSNGTAGFTLTEYTPTFENSFANYTPDALNAPAKYYKTADGIVHLVGLIQRTGSPVGLTIFTLPVGYRPRAGTSKKYIFGQLFSGGNTVGMARIDVQTSGQVQFVGVHFAAGTPAFGDLNWVTISGISFPAA